MKIGYARVSTEEQNCDLANYFADILANYLAKIGELFGNFFARVKNSNY